ncbi:hypothetical protein OG936_20375 [Streptomyces sp. NBC_00846]|nr:hypothetical protein OG936_20375 [Streptomyces sp. NBC_00846]
MRTSRDFLMRNASRGPIGPIGPVTGVPAGLYPAWRASRIQPAEALRR